jgi:hypothetical protein
MMECGEEDVLQGSFPSMLLHSGCFASCQLGRDRWRVCADVDEGQDALQRIVLGPRSSNLYIMPCRMSCVSPAGAGKYSVSKSDCVLEVQAKPPSERVVGRVTARAEVVD